MQTDSGTTFPASIRSVQIPPWFDANLISVGVARMLKFVQIPPWFDANKLQKLIVRLINVVQIPPWFDANALTVILCVRQFTRSNSTVVRCKHSGTTCRRGRSRRFKFHRGSMQTVRGQVAQIVDVAFKFHRGSMQTFVNLRLGVQWKTVQIPPWFDANTLRTNRKSFPGNVQIPPWFDANSGYAEAAD